MTDVESRDMASQRVFKVLAPAARDGCAARLGRLSLPGRKVIDTPNYTAVGSRGVIPHLTPELVSRETSFGAAYMALEDCRSLPTSSGSPILTRRS